MVDIALKVRDMPAKKILHTLDGQQVQIDDFLLRCEIMWPECCVYEKFYHWKREVLTVGSQTEGGTRVHYIRAYYNPLSVCKPDKVHPGRTLGDVAETYDSDMRFTGLSIYMGNGLYVHLPYHGNPNKMDP